ncbi:MAG: hypothetical protein HYT62_03505 [Candidatus Yanofskybacteria bacterium]|nr:hypothetical protein [Candidatus Yanofskybacteria bacterium]
MLITTLSILAYLFTGYTIGKIANSEYLDNTPTEKLGLPRRFKRLLLFPFSYHDWHRRESSTEESPSLRGLFNDSRRSTEEEERERYCRITTFFWPVKLLGIALGIIEIVYFSTTKTIGSLFLIPSQSAKYLGAGVKSLEIATRKLLPASSDLSSSVTDIWSCFKDVEVQIDSLHKQKENLEGSIRKLSENLKAWQFMLSKSKPEDRDHTQIVEITEAIAKEMDQHRKKINDLLETTNTLLGRKRQLEDYATKLTQCKETMNLGILITSASGEGLIKDDAIAVLARSTVSSAQSCITECRALLEKI